MVMRRLAATLVAALAAPWIVLPLPAEARTLRVCADPNNLPYSNQRGEGFENRIVELLAKDLGAEVEYTWWAQRRGFVRNTLQAGLCDLIAGVPSGLEMVATTRPYYRSGYVFVTMAERGLDITGFDDPRLRSLRIGVQMIGDDFSNTPPAHALSRRGIIQNVRGYLVYGNYAQDNPTAGIVEAVARNEVDIAVVWGPQAGFFAQKQPVALSLAPVAPQSDAPDLPMVFDIAMGVRRGDAAFRQEMDEVLRRNRPAIDSILTAYGVPQFDPPDIPEQKAP
jgi:mxaJ protein